MRVNTERPSTICARGVDLENADAVGLATVAGLLGSRGEVRLRWAGQVCPGASQSPSWSGSRHVAGVARIVNDELIVRLRWPLRLAVALSS